MYSLEKLLPAIRALLAEKLVKDFKFSKMEAAKALNLTPSAVSQYLKGTRGNTKILKEKYNLIIDDLAKRVAEDYKKYRVSLKLTHLLDAAYQIISFRPLKEDIKKDRWMNLLTSRLQAEHLAAQRNMSLALTVKNPLVKNLFRQIASDSLRHADIVSSLIDYLDKGEDLKMDPLSKKDIEEILKEEEEAKEASLEELKAINPLVKLLIEVIEQDEEKHLKILRGLVNLS
ncbi:hypothetical protein HRbin06_00901 [archaeon HR06]|nr:hypothetical protein HRbin06_00901 [archaeon HR06]